ncbi:MAG TPA: hypothetical protein VLK65_19655 [Vicinamibacteria bacterium]|nr:hypothetical protein [Vicinamibacteria bacterium]
MTRKASRRWLVLLAILVPSAFLLAAQEYPSISYRDAADHLDEIVWVEGTILRTEKTPEGVYLLFSANEKYVRLLIPTANVNNFDGSLQHMYTGKKVKAVGKVSKYGYKLIVGINEPKRIVVSDEQT